LKTKYRVVGAMSGTSLDGLDLVCVTFEKKAGWNFQIRKAKTYPYSSEWRAQLAQLYVHQMDYIKEVEEKYIDLMAAYILDFLGDQDKIDFISSHGHTVFHQPQKGITFQIGNTPQLSQKINLPVVCDFRTQDVELGGQGAPLVPVGDLHLFKSYSSCLNLGGFANLSKSSEGGMIAYDICAVNIVLNALARKKDLEFDRDGELAQSGKIIPSFFRALESLDYYRQKAPKSLGIEWVDREIFPILERYSSEKIEDLIHTYTVHIAKQIGSLYSKKDTVLITGGGAKNLYLISQITHFTEAKLTIPQAQLVDFKEALIFAFLGVLRVENEVNCLSSVTGAPINHSSGKIFYS
jgi:anhydro-N-acetylmuramic acid kinase